MESMHTKFQVNQANSVSVSDAARIGYVAKFPFLATSWPLMPFRVERFSKEKSIPWQWPLASSMSNFRSRQPIVSEQRAQQGARVAISLHSWTSS